MISPKPSLQRPFGELPAPPDGAAATGAESAFSRLDDLVTRERAAGVARVSSEPAAFAAVARHIERRAQGVGRNVVALADGPVDDAWRELARRLGVGFDATDAKGVHPHEVAAAIARAATGSVIVVGEHRASAWGAAVAAEVGRLAAEVDRQILVVVLRSHRARGAAGAITGPPESRRSRGASPAREMAIDLTIELGSLTGADLRRWWDGVLTGDRFLGQPQLARLAVLDRWWEETRAAQVSAARPPVALDAPAARLLSLLGAARQALTPAQLEALEAGSLEAGSLEALVDARLATVDARGALTLADGVAAPTPTRADAMRLAEVLARAPEADAWSKMRAAELFAASGHMDRSERWAIDALRTAGDAIARRDLWDRWDAVLGAEEASDDGAGGSQDARLQRLVRSAEHALTLGDGERADALARGAMAIAPERFAVLVLHGRASHARGDVTTAALSLTRALGAATSPAERASAAGLLAQVRYMAGDPEQAARYAREAVDHAADVETRLEGRNVLGKLLLAREAWCDAEAHFAEDAYEAAAAGCRTAELRARLNRGIAILYLGRIDEARALLEEVLVAGERDGVPSAVAFTLSNLATIAILQHQFERALEISERAIEIRRQLGGRLGLVEPITNLAELRLRLGLVEEAEQGLRFGLHACADFLPISRYAQFARVAACIHLERGDTTQALRELTSAISGAAASGERSVLAQCHRIAAQIALEDGDLARARAAVTEAKTLRHTAFGQAELAVLEARLARASGEPFQSLAHHALSLSQQADDPESLRNAQVLLFHAYRLEGDDETASSHLRGALEQRDRVAHALPPALRERFLIRRALAELRALESTALDPDQPVSSAAPASAVAPKRRARRLVGDSTPMCALRATVRRVAETDATVLIHGPTGTGKELVAEAIHGQSRRADGPLVKVNCAALVETLLLSELFGHEKGAFTGASARRRGRFELAEGGTLFLDEIGDISPRTQVALLRVLQDGTYERVGGTTQLRASVRIVCATHRDLRAMVERGEFREDLYYRLCGVVVEVPALRDRLDDLAALAQALLAEAGRDGGITPRPLSREALRLLARHTWPGNVRELENALRVAALFCRGEEIEPGDFLEHVEGLRHLQRAAESQPGDSTPGSIRPSPGSTPPSPDEDDVFVAGGASSSEIVYAEVRGGTKLADMKRKLEQDCITRALMECGGNITRAAELLGMKRPRLSQLVKQYDLGTVLEEMKS